MRFRIRRSRFRSQKLRFTVRGRRFKVRDERFKRMERRCRSNGVCMSKRTGGRRLAEDTAPCEEGSQVGRGLGRQAGCWV